jgi:hypothetical protein
VPQGAILGASQTKAHSGGDEGARCRGTAAAAAAAQRRALALQTAAQIRARIFCLCVCICMAVDVTGRRWCRPTCKRLRVPRMLVVLAHGWRFYFGRRRLGGSAVVGRVGTVSHLHHRDAAHLPFQPPAPSLPRRQRLRRASSNLPLRPQLTDGSSLHLARQFTSQSACDSQQASSTAASTISTSTTTVLRAPPFPRAPPPPPAPARPFDSSLPAPHPQA